MQRMELSCGVSHLNVGNSLITSFLCDCSERPRSLRANDLLSKKRPREEEADSISLPISKLSRSADSISISHKIVDPG